MGRPTFERQRGKYVLRDLDAGYHAELQLKDLCRLMHEISGLVYVGVLCEGAVPEQRPRNGPPG